MRRMVAASSAMGSDVDGVADIYFFLLTGPNCVDERRDFGGGRARLTFLQDNIFFFCQAEESLPLL